MPESWPRRLAGSFPNVSEARIFGFSSRHERLTVALHLSPQEPLPVPDATSPTLTREELAARHGVAEEAEPAVRRFASDYGLEVVDIDVRARLVELTGRAGDLERALGLRWVLAQSAGGWHRSHGGPVHLPAYLEPHVQGVLGLDDRRTARSHARAAAPAASPLKAFLPSQLGALYDFPSTGSPNDQGAGQSVAVIELGGGYVPSELEAYFAALGLPMPKVTDVSVNGGANRPGGADDVEVYLDIEVLGALAPAADIAVYFSAGDNYSFIKAIKQAVHDPARANHVLSVSWGGPEKQWQGMEIQAMNEALHEAALLGVTVCVSSGDQGASGQMRPSDGYAHVDFPASSPYALACGGTRTVASDRGLVAESVWFDETGASGGGVSSVFPVPSYQSAAGLLPRTVNPGHWAGRGVPDVAANADQRTGYVLWLHGAWQVVGGTSAAAPLWAALVARLNQGLGKPVGFLHPHLYGARVAATFRDVTVGNNANAAWVGGYRALPGWDPCTGWGTPRGEALRDALAEDGTST